jgi:hypothetical protein
MPRNPNKAPCQASGCHNWAMRGHTHCRSHRDRELGPRRGGAPPGNLNALRTGDHAHPLSPSDLRDLADQLIRQPDHLPEHLSLVAHSLHTRSGCLRQSKTHDPYRTLVALRTVLSDLIPHLALGLFKTELAASLQRLPPSERGPLLRTVKKQLGHQAPEVALLSLRRLMIESQENKKTSTGTGPSPASRDLPGQRPATGPAPASTENN